MMMNKAATVKMAHCRTMNAFQVKLFQQNSIMVEMQIGLSSLGICASSVE